VNWKKSLNTNLTIQPKVTHPLSSKIPKSNYCSVKNKDIINTEPDNRSLKNKIIRISSFTNYPSISYNKKKEIIKSSISNNQVSNSYPYLYLAKTDSINKQHTAKSTSSAIYGLLSIPSNFLSLFSFFIAGASTISGTNWTWVFIGVILLILAFILSILSLHKSVKILKNKTAESSSKIWAVVGIILGSFSLLCALLIGIIAILSFAI
jgi:hypothetical protein